MSDKKVYTRDMVAKLAPFYRGKAENFDPALMGKGKKKSRSQKSQSDGYKRDVKESGGCDAFKPTKAMLN